MCVYTHTCRNTQVQYRPRAMHSECARARRREICRPRTIATALQHPLQSLQQRCNKYNPGTLLLQRCASTDAKSFTCCYLRVYIVAALLHCRSALAISEAYVLSTPSFILPPAHPSAGNPPTPSPFTAPVSALCCEGSTKVSHFLTPRTCVRVVCVCVCVFNRSPPPYTPPPPS